MSGRVKGSGLAGDLYSELVEDFIRDGKQSVIYRYYYEEVFGPDRIKTASSNKKATKKPTDTILLEHYLLGEHPNQSKLYNFTMKLLKAMTQRHDLYDYPNKRLDENSDMAEIIAAIEPFVKPVLAKLPRKGGDKLSKAKLNRMLSDSIKKISKDDECVSKEIVDRLVEHVRDRLIYKAFDEFLYTAGFRIDLDEYKHTARTGKGGRAVAKTDKTLDLIIRYCNKMFCLPFSDADIIEDPDVRDMVTAFADRLVSMRMKKPGNKKRGISIVLAADGFTGITLQLIEECYYPLSAGELSKMQDPQDGPFPPFAFVVLERFADEQVCIYEPCSHIDDDLWIYPDLDSAIGQYKHMVATARDEIIENNYLMFSDDPDGLERDVPVGLRRFFIEEPLGAAEELVEDTIEHISGMYSDEEEDQEFIPKFQK
ncbi:MAG: hypothetical protein K6E19_11475 [Lachnospiraceae bacterium]|nr:hypothetical protein [Lachnospiraceae bacterium]